MGKIDSNEAKQTLETGETNPTPDSQVDLKIKSLTVNIFFDGTRNNLHNTAAARKDPELIKKDVSYENYYSNVALLYMACERSQPEQKIYIQGAGTLEGETDYWRGLGFAGGETGVKARVQEAFDELQAIKDKISSKNTVVNVFGFSRGAFFARYFCYLLHQKQPDVDINFLGLFDTVSSAGLSHYNDVEEFHLNIGKEQRIRHIVHLTAQNDYRDHFPLTRMNTAADDGICFECSLPGAHSNIGGGYSETYKEKQLLSAYDEREYRIWPDSIAWQWFRDKGYYQGDPDETGSASQLYWERHSYGDSERIKSVWGKRKTSYLYQFIPLEIMQALAKEHTGMRFDYGDGEEVDKGIQAMKAIPELNKFGTYAHEEIMKYHTVPGLQHAVSVKQSGLSVAEMKTLYNQYINNSLAPGEIANGGSSDNKALNGRRHDYMQPKRILINDTTGECDDNKWHLE